MRAHGPRTKSEVLIHEHREAKRATKAGLGSRASRSDASPASEACLQASDLSRAPKVRVNHPRPACRPRIHDPTSIELCSMRVERARSASEVRAEGPERNHRQKSLAILVERATRLRVVSPAASVARGRSEVPKGPSVSISRGRRPRPEGNNKNEPTEGGRVPAPAPKARAGTRQSKARLKAEPLPHPPARADLWEARYKC